jgi:hypothetical protein
MMVTSSTSPTGGASGLCFLISSSLIPFMASFIEAYVFFLEFLSFSYFLLFVQVSSYFFSIVLSLFLLITLSVSLVFVGGFTSPKLRAFIHLFISSIRCPTCSTTS